ncbi:Imm8 family immunity protein [Paraburkholderia terricola]|uniref:Imm8 family immunity protein n=1 Tax=Paraburkholderia terricola TaxID=169427 RepID=UPI003BF60999
MPFSDRSGNDFSSIEPFIHSYVAGCSGGGWSEVSRKLARVFAWEFEDYRD